MKKIIALGLILSGMSLAAFAQNEDGFVSLFDGKTFNGWKTATEHTNKFVRLVRESGLASEPVTLGEVELAHLRDVQARLHPSLRLAARISCLPSELPGLVQNLEMLPGLQITAHCATGAINLAARQPEVNLPFTLRSGLPKNANMLWTRLESELAEGHKMELWGETRQDFSLQRTLKQAIDPRRTFSPGRFLGRL